MQLKAIHNTPVFILNNYNQKGANHESRWIFMEETDRPIGFEVKDITWYRYTPLTKRTLSEDREDVNRGRVSNGADSSNIYCRENSVPISKKNKGIYSINKTSRYKLMN